VIEAGRHGSGRDAWIDAREYYCPAVRSNLLNGLMLYPLAIPNVNNVKGGCLTNSREISVSSSLKEGVVESLYARNQ
jgi:hypothetical protein